MNQLAQHANGDVLVFLNDDLLLDPGSLDAGLSCLSNDMSTLCVGHCYASLMELFSIADGFDPPQFITALKGLI